MGHAIVWADIPAIDFKRAVKFYEAVFEVKLDQKFEGIAAFPHSQKDNEVGGCIYDIKATQKYEQQKKLIHEPSKTGPLLYLYVKNVDEAVKAVQSNGGEILLQEQIPWGSRAVIIDSEGNRIALFTPLPKDQMPKF